MADVVFNDNLDGCLGATKEALLRAGHQIAEEAESHAKDHITDAVYSSPNGWYVKTGTLRNSISHGVQETNTGCVVAIGSALKYAPYVELGTGVYAKEHSKAKSIPWWYKDKKGKWHVTKGMPARPYLRPAIEKHKDQYKKILLEEMQNAQA